MNTSGFIIAVISIVIAFGIIYKLETMEK